MSVNMIEVEKWAIQVAQDYAKTKGIILTRKELERILTTAFYRNGLCRGGTAPLDTYMMKESGKADIQARVEIAIVNRELLKDTE